MKCQYIEGESYEFTPSYYLIRFIMGIIFSVCCMLVFLIPSFIKLMGGKNITNSTLLVLALIVVTGELIIGYNIYYGAVGKRSRVKFTREGISVVNPDQNHYEFPWTDFEKAYIMGASSQSVFIVSSRKLEWKERKRAADHASCFPVIFDNDTIVVWCGSEYKKIESILNGVLPIVEDYYYISPAVDK